MSTLNIYNKKAGKAKRRQNSEEEKETEILEV